jgi:hypothetical protein
MAQEIARGASALARGGLGFTLVALAGLALTACGGGGGEGLVTGTGLTPTRTIGTVTRTTPTRTVTSTETTTVPVPIQTSSTASTTSSTSSTPWGWIIVGIALAVALLVGFVLWRRHKGRAEDWGADTARLNRRVLVALDDVLAKGSVVTGQVEALASEVRSLEGRAPDDPSRAAAARVRARLDELAATLETDRRLRLGSPPPSAEQLAYSTEVIRQQTAELQSVLLPPNSR